MAVARRDRHRAELVDGYWVRLTVGDLLAEGSERFSHLSPSEARRLATALVDCADAADEGMGPRPDVRAEVPAGAVVTLRCGPAGDFALISHDEEGSDG